nr:MAG TPA_asm: hypothetical protein [Caudoviricetes sp.]
MPRARAARDGDRQRLIKISFTAHLFRRKPA